MKNQLLVTIGIPAYNAERFIALAIKSVLAQTYSDFELIITDDGSTDRTVEIARSFDDPRISVLADGENHGISYRLNQQIGLAKGKYFARMDADDLMMPDRIEKQVKYLESRPDVSVISGQAVIIDDSNRIIGIRADSDKSHKFTIDDWINGKTLIHPTVAGRIDFFRRYRYRYEFKGVEDMDLWARTCRENNLVILPMPILFYRDPLRFKLSTYKFRRRQSEKLYKNLSDGSIITKSVCRKSILKSKLKSIIASALSIINLDAVMVSKRNKPLEIHRQYESILEKIVSTD